jgi:hypothetical protein
MKPERIRVVVLCVAALMISACWTPNTAAQPGRGGPELAPEKAEEAWKLEAVCVSQELGLSEKDTEVLVDTYKAARKGYQEAVQKLFEDQEGDRRSRYQAYRELREKERGKLEEALKGTLNEKQLAEAIASLGTFDRRWDRYVDSLVGFELGEEKLFKALSLVNQYVVDRDKAMQEAIANEDWESMRETRREMKERLDAALAAVLSEDQQAKWSEATAFRRRGR